MVACVGIQRQFGHYALLLNESIHPSIYQQNKTHTQTINQIYARNIAHTDTSADKIIQAIIALRLCTVHKMLQLKHYYTC